MTTAAPFTREPDERCLRGLTFRYTTVAPFCARCFADAVRVRHPAGLVEGTERLGSVTTMQMIRPFRFELRFELGSELGSGRDVVHQVEVHHRLSAGADAREQTYEMVEDSLRRALQTLRCRHARP